MTTILFVDIDGVLRPEDPKANVALGPSNREIDHERVKALAEVLAAFPDVRVVISSTWRHLERLHDLQQRLVPLPVVGATGPRVGTRYEDLRGHAYKRCTSWLALDDDDSGWPEEERWRLVKCEPTLGLGPGELRELASKLDAVQEDEVVASMQTEESKAGVRALFRSTPRELGEAAVWSALKERR